MQAALRDKSERSRLVRGLTMSAKGPQTNDLKSMNEESSPYSPAQQFLGGGARVHLGQTGHRWRSTLWCPKWTHLAVPVAPKTSPGDLPRALFAATSSRGVRLASAGSLFKRPLLSLGPVIELSCSLGVVALREFALEIREQMEV